MRARVGRGSRTFRHITAIGALALAVPILAAPAQAKAPTARLSLHTAAASFKVSTAVGLTGSVTPAGKGGVTIERLSGKTWAVIAHTTSTSSGTFAASVKAPKAATTWTVRAVRAKSGKVPALTSKAVVVHVVKTAFSVTATGATVTEGDPLVVTGAVSPMAKGSVVLQLHSGTQWLTLAKATLTTTGGYRLTATKPFGSYGLRVLRVATSTVAQGLSKALILQVIRPPVVVSTTTLPDGNAGIPYTATLSATGGLPPYTWTASGLPAGISLTSAGQLVGTSAVVVHAAPTLTATDAAGQAASVTTSLFFSLPASATQQLWAWGNGVYGALGTGDDPSLESSPRAVGLTGVTAVTAGSEAAFALRYDGSVWAWGSDVSGDLGDGGAHSASPVLRPIPVNGLGRTVGIASGGATGYALSADGTVWSWGANATGELGDGTTTSRSTAAQIPGLSRITAISAGDQTAYALDQDGVLWSWGFNGNGELGDGTTTTRATPQRVPGLGHVVAVSAGPEAVAAVLADGSLFTWGRNDSYELGIGNNVDKAVPTPVAGVSGVVAVALNRVNGYAISSTGVMWSWGYGAYGGMGGGATTDQPSPVTVLVPAARSVAAGPDSATVRLADGTVATWGANGVGQLGNGTTTQSSTPVKVDGLTNVVAVGSGQLNAYAITAS